MSAELAQIKAAPQQGGKSTEELEGNYQESLSLIEDLKKMVSDVNKEKEALQKQYQAKVDESVRFQKSLEESASQIASLGEENKRLKSAMPKSTDSKQLVKCQQRISELEAEVEAANKRSNDVFEEGKVLAKKQLEMETKDRALKAKLRERNDELASLKKQLSDTSFRLEKTTETVMKLQDQLENTSSSHSTNSKKLEEIQRDYENLKQLHAERERLYASMKEETEGATTTLAHTTSEYEKAKSEL